MKSLLFLSLLALSCSSPKKPAKHAALKDGRDDYQEKTLTDAELTRIVKQAADANKRVLLMFGGDWCSWCHALHKTFDEDPGVKAALDKFVLVTVDIDSNDALDQKLGKPSKHGFPVLVVLGKDGKKLHVQETGSLEKKGATAHDPAKVIAFLTQWSG